MNKINNGYSSSSSSLSLNEKFYKLFQSSEALDPRIIGSNLVIDYSNILLGSDSIYSCEQPVHVNQWINLLKDILFISKKQEINKENLSFSCIDATANVGAWSLNVAFNFQNVSLTSLELNSNTCSLLKSNIIKFELQISINLVKEKG